MKRLFIISAMVLSLMVLPLSASAGWGIPIGKVDIDVDASNSAHSGKIDFDFSPFGLAVGGGSMSAGMEGGACGIMINGSISAEFPTEGNFGGGFSVSGKMPDLGTWTQNHAAVGADLDLTASGFFAIGGVGGEASGYAEQCSLNTGGGIASGGITVGMATQESSGGFGGEAYAGVILIGRTGAGFDASIVMDGYSHTNSYTWSGGGKGLGTAVMATTTVNTSGGSDSYGCFISDADVGGGFSASGDVSSFTAQSRNGGNASASANGSYSGAASLGYNYNGSAVGYTETFGANSGVMHSGAGMSVTSTMGR